MAHATKYYVSNAGSDAANGLTTGTAWKTLAHAVVSIANKDSIFLNKSDTWIEQFYPTVDSIYVGAYGTGNYPVITGFKNVTMSLLSGNIYTGTATNTVARQNTVTINGLLGYKARFPNTGYSVATSFPSTSRLIVPHTATNYTNGQAVSRGQRWAIDAVKIASDNQGVTNDTFNFANTTTYNTLLYYFVQNLQSLIDTVGEWSIDSATKVISVYGNYPVQYSSFDTLVNLSQRKGVVIENITFTGANNIAISMNAVGRDTIRNCNFKNNGTGVYCTNARYIASYNNSFDSSLSNAWVSATDTSTYFYNNSINHTGQFAGMGNNILGNSTIVAYIGAFIGVSDNSYVKYNSVLNSGYSGIRWQGNSDSIIYNYVNTYCNVKDDGGGVYTTGQFGNNKLDSLSYVGNNIILNGVGAPLSVSDNAFQVAGLYSDDYASYITFEYNTIDSISDNAIQAKGQNLTFKNNTIRFNKSGTIGLLSTSHANYSVKNNLFNSLNSNTFLSYTGALDATISCDSNNYTYPIQQTPVFANSVTYNGLAAWKIATGYDAHSSVAFPYGITTYTPTLFYNPTTADSTIVISQGYYDIKGNGYATSFILSPMGSRLLWAGFYNPPTYLYRLNYKIQ